RNNGSPSGTPTTKFATLGAQVGVTAILHTWGGYYAEERLHWNARAEFMFKAASECRRDTGVWKPYPTDHIRPRPWKWLAITRVSEISALGGGPVAPFPILRRDQSENDGRAYFVSYSLHQLELAHVNGGPSVVGGETAIARDLDIVGDHLRSSKSAVGGNLDRRIGEVHRAAKRAAGAAVSG